MKLMKYLIYIVVFILIHLNGYSQSYSLDDCIRIGIENSLLVKQSKLNSEMTGIDVGQAKSRFYPNVDFSYNLGMSGGRSIDPYTNAYLNQQLAFSNVGSNLNLLLFNGGRLKSQLNKFQTALVATEKEIEEQKDRVALDIIVAYTTMLNNKAIINLNQQRKEATLTQLERLRILDAQEAGDPAILIDLEGQYFNDSLSIVVAINTFRNSKVALCQLMNINYSDDIRFEDYENINFEPQVYDASEVFQKARNKFSAFEARNYRIEAAELAIAEAQSSLKPSVFLFSGINSNYSSAAARLIENGSVVRETDYFINGENGDIPVMLRSLDFQSKSISYPSQIFNNISGNAGIAISVPIFQQRTVRNNISRAKIDLENSQLDLMQTELDFKQAIERICIDMENTIKRIQILEIQLVTFEESFRINQVKLDNGVSNNVAYIISKNNLENGRLQLSTARFEYQLLKKVLDFYMD